jgi:uncharacterized membrane protein YcaP (DUF421 family)
MRTFGRSGIVASLGYPLSPPREASSIQDVLGYELDVADVDSLQMALRTVVVYVATLLLIRIGSKRFLSQASAFDVIVAIMLGSVMSRAINGSAPLVPTLAAGAVFIGLHWLLSAVTARTSRFGPLVKGNPVLLIEDGEVQQQGLRKTGLSSRDLEEALRLNAPMTDPSNVKLAYLERNGRVSVVPNPSEPRVVDVSVADGVQVVRVEVG